MRFKSLLAALAVVLSVAMIVPGSAEAGWRRSSVPDGWGRTRTINHYIYYPRYRHVYRVHPHTDPYAYYYEPRGYYTKSSSRYWRRADRVHRHHKVRGHHKYRYHPAWGYKKARKSRRRWLR